VVLDDEGIHGRGLVRRRTWHWPIVACVSYESDGGLAVCVRGDPYVKSITTRLLSTDACRALLDDCRPFVEAHGSRVMSDVDVVAMWWAAQPESRPTCR
jgi:hypothetical protein